MGSWEMRNDERIPRGFQIWHQNSNQITFDPLFGHKKLSKIGYLPDLACFQHFFGKRGSNVIRFEFWGQIWNLLIISHLLGPHLILFLHFDFLTSYAIFGPQMWARYHFFKEIVNFVEFIVISVKKMHQKGGETVSLKKKLYKPNHATGRPWFVVSFKLFFRVKNVVFDIAILIMSLSCLLGIRGTFCNEFQAKAAVNWNAKLSKICISYFACAVFFLNNIKWNLFFNYVIVAGD